MLFNSWIYQKLGQSFAIEAAVMIHARYMRIE